MTENISELKDQAQAAILQRLIKNTNSGLQSDAILNLAKAYAVLSSDSAVKVSAYEDADVEIA